MSLINDMLKDLEKRHAEEAYPKGVALAGIGLQAPAGMRGAQWLFYLGGVLAVAILVFVFKQGLYPATEFQGTGSAARATETIPLPLSDSPAAETDEQAPPVMVASVEPPASAGRISGPASVPASVADEAMVNEDADAPQGPAITADSGEKAGNGVTPNTAAVSPGVAPASDTWMPDVRVPVPVVSLDHGGDAGDMTAAQGAAPGSVADGGRPDAAAGPPKAVADGGTAIPDVKQQVATEAVGHGGDAVHVAAAPEAGHGSAETGASHQRTAAAAPAGLKKIIHPLTVRERARRLRGEALRLARRGELDQAEDKLSKALSLEPDHVAARDALAGLMIQNGQLAQAAALLDRGLKLKPGSAALVELRARVYVMQGDNQRAKTLLEENAPKVGQDPEYHAMLAAVYQRLGDYDKAGAVYQALVNEKPQNGVWWLGLGLSMEATGRVEEAKQAYQKAQVSRVLSPKLRRFVKNKLASLS